MLKINDSYYDINILDIILELKYQLQLNGNNLFGQIKDTQDNLMVSCPFHKNGQERRPSCGIKKTNGLFHCFTCGETVSLTEAISRCFGKDDFGKYGTIWLRNNFLGDLQENRDFKIDIDRYKPISNVKYISDQELNKYRYYHNYMFKRKMTEEVIEKFDIGFDKETNCITFPVKDEFGNCLFIARRSVINKFFNYPSNVEKPVYGLYELKKYAKDVDEIIICESMINAITCWVYGKYAVALNGTGTDYQYEQLKKLKYRKYILALDPDEAGNKGRKRLRKALGNYKIISEYEIPVGKDVNDLSKEEFDNLKEIF